MKLNSKDDVVRREIADRIAAQEHEFNAQSAALDAATARFLAGHSAETHEAMMKRFGEWHH